jgi:hypothetical protein
MLMFRSTTNAYMDHLMFTMLQERKCKARSAIVYLTILSKTAEFKA